jgi:hypothetical protein
MCAFLVIICGGNRLFPVRKSTIWQGATIPFSENWYYNVRGTQAPKKTLEFVISSSTLN